MRELVPCVRYQTGVVLRRPRTALQRLPWITSLRCALAAVILLLPARFTSAQQFPPVAGPAAPARPTAPDQPTGTPLSEQIPVGQVEVRLAALEAVVSPTPEQQRILEQLRAATGFLAQIAEATRQIENFQRDGSDIEKRAAALQSELERPAADPLAGVDPTTSVEQLEAMLQSARVALTNEQQALKSLQDELANRTIRRERIPEERRAAEAQLERLNAALVEPPAAGDAEELRDARRWRLLAERRMYEMQLRLLTAELESYDARRPLREPRQTVQQRRTTAAEARVHALTEVLNRRRELEAQMLQEQAQEARRAASAAHPIVRAVRDENTSLASELSDVLQRTRQQQEATIRSRAATAALMSQQANVRKRVRDVGGHTEAIGMQLRQWLNDLPDIAAEERAARELEREMNRVLLRLKEITEQRQSLLDIGSAAESALTDTDQAIPLEHIDDVQEALETALREQDSAFLAPLDRAYDTLFNDVLIERLATQRELISQARQFHAYIEENIFWVQSTQPLRLADFSKLDAAFRWLLDPALWRAALASAFDGMQQRTPIQVVGWLIVGLLTALRVRIFRTLAEMNDRVRRRTVFSYGTPITSLGLVATLAIPAPLALWLIALALRSAQDPPLFALQLAAGLTRIGSFLFIIRFWSHLCREGGVGQTQFEWREQSLRMVRRHVRWFLPSVLPLAFVHTITNQQAFDPHQDVLGRVAFISAMVLSSVFAWRVLNTRTGIFREFVAKFRGGWVDRLRFFWFPSLVLLPVAFAVLAASGYFYTAIQLEMRTLYSVVFTLSMIIVGGVIMRWIMLAQRRMAMEQAKKRIKQLAESQEVGAEGDVAKIVQAADEVDVEALTRQSRRLARNVIGFAALLGLLMVWSDVLPALRVLEQFQLTWTKTVVSLSPDGALERGEARVTMLDALLAIVIFTLTIVIGQNLPAALEITLLQRLPLSQGGRYATSTIVRYLIYIVGIVWSFDIIGLGWSKVQWLAAAITVGLGFGLQEIVANFVSGIILLFEQPIRVGDTVTVGDKTGTVSRIRMRATTIVDWDRKELIIPNKEFVTGRITNWTLSDTVLRIAVPVGVAYGTDTALVRRILLDVARSTDHILADPPPVVVFQQFGDSSLSFELRFFVPSLSCFVPVRTEVMEKINTAFSDAGVVIPFPQRDLHFKSAQPIIRIEHPGVHEPER